MYQNKILLLSLICFSLQAGRPLSGLNTKDFLAVQEEQVEWTDNPFIQQRDDSGIDELTLLGIAYNKYHSAALINNQIVQTGDKIGSSEVVLIERNEVVLRNANGIFKLLFKRTKNEKN